MPQARPRKRKKRSKKFKFLIFLLAASAIAAVVYFNLKKEKPLETFATIEIKSGALVDKLAETGSIELVRTVEVKSTIPGEINQLMIEAGDWVEEGQLMAIIEPDPNQSLQLYQKRSAVERGQINLQEQEKDFNRTKALFESKMLPSKKLRGGGDPPGPSAQRSPAGGIGTGNPGDEGESETFRRPVHRRRVG